MTKKTNTTIYKPKGYNQLAKATRLPKLQYGDNLYDKQPSTLDYINQEQFAPSPSPQYENLAANTKFTNEQEFGPGLSAEGGDFIKSDGDAGVDGGFNISSAASIAGTAAQLASSLVGDQSENPQYGNFESIAADTMSQYGPIGQVAGAIGEAGGKLLKPDYDEYGVAKSKSDEIFYYQAGAYFDPLGAAQNQETFGEGVLAALLPGWGGENVRKREEADALKRRSIAVDTRNQAGLKKLNEGVVDYLPVTKYGGRLPKKANGGAVDPVITTTAPVVSDDIKMQLFKSNRPDTMTTTVTPNVYRRRTRENTLDTMINQFGMTREEALGQYSPEVIDSLANISNRYKSGISSVGQPVLNEYIPNVGAQLEFKKQGGQIGSKTPVVQQYGGQLHTGPDEGVRVDTNGNPTAVTGNEPVALTEKGEVSYNGYVFSDSIKYKK